MSILVVAEINDGAYKKSTFEAITYAQAIASSTGESISVLNINSVTDASQVGLYGASKSITVGYDQGFDSQVHTDLIEATVKAENTTVVVLANSSTGKSLVGRLSVRLKAGSVSGATAAPIIEGGKFTVQKSVFSGKAYVNYAIETAVKVISIAGNTFPPVEKATTADVVASAATPSAAKVKVISSETVTGTVPLPEAELVVSAGRGLKGPENWGIIEELANTIGATTACSRPVADSDWRPHHEHVGQTGVAIKPNLYFAIGISGAIQHLAGVNNSKVIVVINKDPEAPFFGAADYGVVGDLFEVVPKLTAALAKFKAS